RADFCIFQQLFQQSVSRYTHGFPSVRCAKIHERRPARSGLGPPPRSSLPALAKCAAGNDASPAAASLTAALRPPFFAASECVGERFWTGVRLQLFDARDEFVGEGAEAIGEGAGIPRGLIGKVRLLVARRVVASSPVGRGAVLPFPCPGVHQVASGLVELLE